MIFNVPLDTVTKTDIDRLIANQVPESLELDYKLELKVAGRDDKKEFLADVTAFNNTQGGLLIFGVQEGKDEKGRNTGLPDKVIPLVGYNEDKLTLQLEGVLRDGIQPALTAVQFGFVPYDDGFVLLLRVPPNYSTPRMVAFGKTNRFYRRVAGGKYLPDVYELEEMFMRSGSQKDRLVVLHRSRLEELKSSNIFPNVMKNRFLFLHVLPLTSGSKKSIDFNDRNSVDKIRESLGSVFPRGFNARFNIDGYQVYSEARDQNGRRGKTIEYSQCFRNGGIEVYSFGVSFKNPESGEMHISYESVEVIIENSIASALEIGKLIDQEPPFVVKMTLRCGKDISLKNQFGPRSFFFDREEIEFPDIVLMKDNQIEVKKDLGDLVWQAAGVSRFKQ